MKKINHIFLISLLILIATTTACQKDEEMNSMGEVEAFIEKLKEGTYNSIYLPEFESHHIPILLNYRNSTLNINDYPVNPISSMYLPECKLGIYVLWVIESIRLNEIEPKQTFAGFPSLNPVLRYQQEDWANSELSQEIAAQAYLNWWNSGDFEEIKYINPLANTNFSWH